ncbi:hypothetical protein HYW17_05715 [Candidatus Uhrbacteria bacterium]|nr:hypothetical protein [Candidatus Uhrbacteria bacterium]
MRITHISRKTAVHLTLFLVVGGIMAVNAAMLYRAQNKVAQEKLLAEEAAKPAKIELVLLTATDCKECFRVENVVEAIKSNPGAEISKEEFFEHTSDQGIALIKQYGITRVPTVLIRGEIEKVFDQPSFIENLGKRAEDGTLVVSNVPAPYIEVPSGAVKGKFSVTYVSDKSCAECYDVALHRRALAGLAMTPSEEKFVDRGEGEGQRLIALYKIVSAPTILISGDLAEYPQFQQVWTQVGTVEKDGTHIFRAGQQLMGVYHDLKTGKVVKPEPPAQAPTVPPTQ